ncbi:MAG: type II toxin-antitoxin system PemK/MazF family toxin [Flavobacteriales bacterium]
MKQGEIWSVDLDPTQGAEIRKTRPVIIVNDDALGRLPLKVVVPLTEWKDRYAQAPWMVRVDADQRTRLSKPSAADCFQVRSISEMRFVARIGTIDGDTMGDVRTALAAVLSIPIG